MAPNHACCFLQFNKLYPYTLNVNLYFQKHNTETFNTKLWGASSDSSDVIQECCDLPELKLGDWLAVQNVGAYTLTKACTYNGIPVCPVRRVVNEKLWAKFNAGQSDCK